MTSTAAAADVNSLPIACPRLSSGDAKRVGALSEGMQPILHAPRPLPRARETYLRRPRMRNSSDLKFDQSDASRTHTWPRQISSLKLRLRGRRRRGGRASAPLPGTTGMGRPHAVGGGLRPAPAMAGF